MLLVVAVSSATWASRDARRRTDSGGLAFAAGALVMLTFPFGPLVYARFRHRLSPPGP